MSNGQEKPAAETKPAVAPAAPRQEPKPVGVQAAAPKPKSGLWRNNAATPEGKYLVKRRDGTVPEWPSFVLGARDPMAPAALRAYAEAARILGMDPRFVADVRELAEEFERYRAAHGAGDPDRGRHRQDDPATVAEMGKGRSA